MPQWMCVITSRREDGTYTWKRIDAAEPRGTVSSDQLPSAVSIGDKVLIETANNFGRSVAVRCVPIYSSVHHDEAHPNATPVITEIAASAEAQQDPMPGHLVWANVLNPLEDPEAAGKFRPVVLVDRSETHWRVMGLTTKSTYNSGEARRRIPHHLNVGLNGPGYLWGNRLTRITLDSVGQFIGYADDALIAEIVDLARADITDGEIDELRSISRPAARARQAEHLTSVLAATTQEVGIKLESNSLIQFVERNRDQSERDLREYFHSGNFTGRDFEMYSRMANRHRLDGNDIAAVMCLGVVPATNVPSQILEIPPLLSESERYAAELPIWRRPLSDYEPGSTFWRIWDQLVAIENVGWTIASKLMASKFPASIPIWDRDVSSLLGRPSQYWAGWYESMQSASLRRVLTDLQTRTETEHVSLLRIVDVVLWMEAQRRKKTGSL